MTGDSSSSALRAIARTALTNAGYAVDDLELIRVGTNAVFACDDLVVRVAPADYDRLLLDQQIGLARWLVERGFPTAAPVGETLVTDGHPVTFWQRVRPSRSPGMKDLGELARDFHEVTQSYPGDLPAWEPLGRLGDRLERLEPDSVLSRSDCELLHGWKDTLVAAVRDLDFKLPPGPIHGDIHTGNVIASEFGPYLIDFDRIATGPREWDLADPLAGTVFFASDQHGWDAFVEQYGYDLRTFAGVDELVELRGLFMLSWLLTLERTPRIEAEIRTRLRYFYDPAGTISPWSPV